jgi:predicted nuclease of predicted toxin-antitoxin system
VPAAIQFHLDESAPLAVAIALRLRGIDVTTARDAGLLNSTDLEHLEFARREGRVIFTQDTDFLAMHRGGTAHAGLVYCRQQSRTIGEMVRTSRPTVGNLRRDGNAQPAGVHLTPAHVPLDNDARKGTDLPDRGDFDRPERPGSLAAPHFASRGDKPLAAWRRLPIRFASRGEFLADRGR